MATVLVAALLAPVGASSPTGTVEVGDGDFRSAWGSGGCTSYGSFALSFDALGGAQLAYAAIWNVACRPTPDAYLPGECRPTPDGGRACTWSNAGGRSSLVESPSGRVTWRLTLSDGRSHELDAQVEARAPGEVAPAWSGAGPGAYASRHPGTPSCDSVALVTFERAGGHVAAAAAPTGNLACPPVASPAFAEATACATDPDGTLRCASGGAALSVTPAGDLLYTLQDAGGAVIERVAARVTWAARAGPV